MYLSRQNCLQRVIVGSGAAVFIGVLVGAGLLAQNAPDPRGDWQLRSEVHKTAREDKSRDRVKLGLAEEVVCFTTPKQFVDWTVEGGEIFGVQGNKANQRSQITVIARETPGKTIVTAQNKGEVHTITFDVVAPEAVKFELISKAAVNGQPAVGRIGVFMVLDYWLLPADVSFYKLQVKELGAPTENFTGIFVDHKPENHKESIEWHAVRDDNATDGNDLAGFSRPNLTKDDFEDSEYIWNIPWAYNVPSDRVTKHTFTTVQQKCSIDTEGQSRVDKGDQHAVRGVDDPPFPQNPED